MKRIFISALALLGMGVMANAQEKVIIHNGSESYVTNVEYITFDATEADEAVSVSALQTEITSLTSEKTTLEGQVSTLTSEKAELEAELENIKDQIEKTGTIGHDYVDLGLPSGTLWATMNVGASSPEESGDNFAWGETEAKEYYGWSTYKWCNGSEDTQTKYCRDSSHGTVDNKTELEAADDVAVQAWGGAWKMPTSGQQRELYDECYWVWTNGYNGTSVHGYIVYKAKEAGDKGTIVYDGNTPSLSYSLSDVHIFLPAAGMGNWGYYWSSSEGGLYPGDAQFLLLQSSGVLHVTNSRCAGQSVRPVCPGTK